MSKSIKKQSPMRLKKLLFDFVEKAIKLDEKYGPRLWNFFKFWSIPVIGIYVYAVTVLTQYGFDSYYNIPSNFVEASIQSNILYFFSLFQLLWSVIVLIGWPYKLGLLFAALLVISVCFESPTYKKIVATICTISLLLLPWNSFNIGRWIASTKTNYYVLSSGCKNIGPDGMYIIPNFFEDKAILIPINPENKTLNGGFIMKDVSQLGCALERSEIGQIKK